MSEFILDLEAVSRGLQAVHQEILAAEGAYLPGRTSLALLDKLIHDPEWAWLRALSKLIADLDELIAVPADLTPAGAAAAAGRVRALVFGLGEPRDEAVPEPLPSAAPAEPGACERARRAEAPG